MLFNSFEFLLLVAVTAGLYYSSGLVRFQVLILVAASVIFYAAFQPILLLLLIVVLAINVLTSHAVVYGAPERSRMAATLGVLFNLGVLIFFKYGTLLAVSMGAGSTSFGEFLLALPLPLGISFFTFHGITLLVDTFRAHSQGINFGIHRPLTAHSARIGLYFLFFPQLVAGPITKSRLFLPQIVPKRWADVDLAACFRQATLGYFLKMVVADNLAQQTYWIAHPYFLAKSSSDLLVMLAGYSLQIFSDFAGYSLIALGIAGLFGYRLPENFNSPYLAHSFSNFWTRWHISLSSFLREYLYLPLGGNRHGRLRTYLNLMTVMLLGGMWHGAAWSFMVWGAAHGLALVVERAVEDHITLPAHAALRVLRTLFVFLYVSFAWLLFKLTDFSHVLEFLRSVSNNWRLESSVDLNWMVLMYAVPVIAYHCIKEFPQRTQWLRERRIEPLIYGLMLFLIVTNSGESQDFVYFQF